MRPVAFTASKFIEFLSELEHKNLVFNILVVAFRVSPGICICLRSMTNQ